MNRLHKGVSEIARNNFIHKTNPNMNDDDDGVLLENQNKLSEIAKTLFSYSQRDLGRPKAHFERRAENDDTRARGEYFFFDIFIFLM